MKLVLFSLISLILVIFGGGTCVVIFISNILHNWKNNIATHAKWL